MSSKLFSRLKLPYSSEFWFIFFVALILIALSALLPIYTENRKLYQQTQQLQKEVEALKMQNASCREEIQNLQKNPAYVEFLLRQKASYGRKEEKIFDK